MAILSPPPKLQFFDANGNPLVGGKLYSYMAGTTSPLATYADATEVVANPNPIILDSRGEASVWLGLVNYKLVLYSATNVLIWSVDNVNTTGSTINAGVATWLVTPSSANLAAAVTDETGTGALVFATSPTLTTPTLGAATLSSINSGQIAGFRNRIINGDISVAQRGLQAGAATPYTVDRWRADRTAGTLSWTTLANTAYGGTAALSVGLVAATGNAMVVAQRIERQNCADLVGKNVTVSFWAAGSTTSGTATFSIALNYANALNNFATTTIIASNTLSLTSFPAYYTYTFTNLPAGVDNGLEVRFDATQATGSGTVTLNIGTVQLEQGSVATPFERIDAATQQMRCQRYYQTNDYWFGGYVQSTFSVGYTIPFGTYLRSGSPTTTLTSINTGAVSGTNSGIANYRSIQITNTGTGSGGFIISGIYAVQAEL